MEASNGHPPPDEPRLVVTVGGFTGEAVEDMPAEMLQKVVQETGEQLGQSADFILIAVPSGQIVEWQQKIAAGIGVKLQ